MLREHVADWFELDGDVPYMVQVYPIRAKKRPLIPAVTHADGTGRLQTVTAADNGVPMVLNTRQALDCFLRTRMDVLVLADVLERRGSGCSS